MSESQPKNPQDGTGSIQALTINHDGTSQSQRTLNALQTNHALIDDRSTKDFLVLAQQFSQELKYFDFDNNESGDWSRFINPGNLSGQGLSEWLQQIENFLQTPENIADDRYADLHRPHFVLFLTFLQLLKNSQTQVNQLTSRHLEFYYRTLLNFTLNTHQPDQVNVLITPLADNDRILLPAGTLLAAGKDSLGKDLVYGTDSDLVVNQTKIEQISSIYINKQVIGIREKRMITSGDTNEKLIAMLQMALGEPEPGGDLPEYPTKEAMGSTLLQKLKKLVQFVGKADTNGDGLFMEIGELRALIKLKTQSSNNDNNDWQTINNQLTEIGRYRHDNPSFTLTTDNELSSKQFEDNLKDALNVDSVSQLFTTLNLVKNITELYEQKDSEEVTKQDFINKYFKNRDVLIQMMEAKLRIDKEWQDIYALLERAGQRRVSGYKLDTSAYLNSEQAFESALGTPKYPNDITNLDGFYTALLEIERYFYMPLEDFRNLMESGDTTTEAEWDKLVSLLAVVHQKKISTHRKSQLTELQKNNPSSTDAIKAMMRLALGFLQNDTSSLTDLMTGIKELLPTGTNLSVFERVNTPDLLAKDPLTEGDWESVVNKLEIAWRNRDPIPEAKIINWLSVNAYSDTSAGKVPGNSDTSRWYTFGQRQPQTFAKQDKPPVAVNLGWAISSPLLCLAQGDRTVILTLVFKPANFDFEKIKSLLVTNKAPVFRMELSTDKGWIIAQSDPVEKPESKNYSLSWKLTFKTSSPAITPLPETDSSGMKSPWPILRLLLQPRWDEAVTPNCYVTDYSLFQGLLLDQVQLNVEVNGLSECKLQNDDQTFPPGKPFEPFGSFPAIGSRFYFVHPELVCKKLKTLEIVLPWMGVQNANLKDYYQNYTDKISGNSVFKSKVVLVDQKVELILNKNIEDTETGLYDAGLFKVDDATSLNTLTVPGQIAQEANIETIDEAIIKSFPSYNYERQLTVNNQEDVTVWSRYWFLELSGCDFQHAAYPSIAASQAIKLAIDMTDPSKRTTENGVQKLNIDPATYKVNPPYTPKLKSFSINYSAGITLNETDFKNQGADQIFHIHPFGYAPIQFDDLSGGFRFLPAYENEGELYLGLSGVNAPQTLTMLLQMAEGTSNPDLTPATVSWSVLNGNRWQKLDQGQLQQDGTNGLVQSGIVKLQLDAAAPSTLLPKDLYWLRATIEAGCNSVCDCIGIDTQAVSATFIDQDNAEDHYFQPLPANTLTKLITPISGIEIKQPYTSFGAKPKEQQSRFATRVSERLRHKQRAVSHWDYERIVLERYPEIYKAKCISVSLGAESSQVTVIVIPDMRNRLPFNPFEPKASSALLADIENYLNSCAPIGANVKVKNARYQPVKLRFEVGFHPGCDSGFYIKQLNEDINRFLSPWAYDQGKDIIIGGRIYANAIINYLDRLPYVDYVDHFKMFTYEKGGSSFEQQDKPAPDSKSEGYAVTANAPDVVLVAANAHVIGLITDINYGEHNFKGINYMMVGFDFKVA